MFRVQRYPLTLEQFSQLENTYPLSAMAGAVTVGDAFPLNPETEYSVVPSVAPLPPSINTLVSPVD